MNKQILFGVVTAVLEQRVTPGGVLVAETRLVTEDVINRAAAQSVHKQTHFLRGYGGVAARMLQDLAVGSVVWVEGAFVSEKAQGDRWKWHTKVSDFRKLAQREPEPDPPRKAPPPPPACLLDD